MIEFTALMKSVVPLSVDPPIEYRASLAAMAERCKYATFRITEPRRPRTTGYRSENAHTHGHYADIAEQLSTASVVYSQEEIGRAIKLMAMKAGEWPSKRDASGQTIIDPITKALEPLSEGESTVEESARLIAYIHWWAATNSLWLTEYVDGMATRIYASDLTLFAE